MKRILFLLLIISSIAKAQSDDSTKYINYRYKYGNRESRGQFDSVFKIPFVDTSLFHPARPGALLMRPADSLIYQWNGAFWGVLVGSGGGSGSGTVNSGTQYRIAYYAGTGTAVSQAAAITGNRALISDANGVPTHSAVTNTELGHISGVTSAVQTQINKNQDSLRNRYMAVRAINDTMWALRKWNGSAYVEDTVAISLANGDKGDITISNGWTNWTIDNGAVTDAKVSSGISQSKISNLTSDLASKQPNIQFKDEGTNIGTSGGITNINFTGAGVTASHSSGAVTVNIPGGGSGGSVNDFRELKFKVGTTVNAPNAGDSLLVYSAYNGKKLNVFREGELQFDSSSSNGYERSGDTIKFHPSLFANERVIIQAYPDSNWTYDGLPAPSVTTLASVSWNRRYDPALGVTYTTSGSDKFINDLYDQVQSIHTAPTDLWSEGLPLTVGAKLLQAAVNGRDVIYVEPNKYLIQRGYDASNQVNKPLTILFYVRPKTTTGFKYFTFNVGDGPVRFGVDGTKFFMYNGAVLEGAAAAAAVDGDYVVLLEINGGGNDKIYINGTLYATGDAGSAASYYSGVRLGFDNTDGGSAYLGRYYVKDGVFSDADKTALISELKTYYGF